MTIAGAGRSNEGAAIFLAIFSAILYIAIGVLMAWLSTITMYAIGEAADQAQTANFMLDKAADQSQRELAAVEEMKATIARLQDSVNELQQTVNALKGTEEAPAPAPSPNVPKLTLKKEVY